MQGIGRNFPNFVDLHDLTASGKQFSVVLIFLSTEGELSAQTEEEIQAGCNAEHRCHDCHDQ